MSEIKKDEKTKPVESTPTQTPLPVPTPGPIQTSNTIDPLAGLSDEDRRKVESVRAFYADQSTENLLRGYESFGKSKAERDKVWARWSEINKGDANAIFKGLVPLDKAKEPIQELDLTKIEDEKVRREIFRIWLEKATGRKFKEHQAEVVN